MVQAAQHAGGFLLAAHRRVEIDHKLLGIVALVAQHKGDHGAVVFHRALVKAGAVLIVVVTDIHIHVQLGPVLFAAGQNAQHAFAHVHTAAVELIQINGIRRGKRPLPQMAAAKIRAGLGVIGKLGKADAQHL